MGEEDILRQMFYLDTQGTILDTITDVKKECILGIAMCLVKTDSSITLRVVRYWPGDHAWETVRFIRGDTDASLPASPLGLAELTEEGTLGTMRLASIDCPLQRLSDSIYGSRVYYYVLRPDSELAKLYLTLA
ncbi:MAG: hypothetical protein ABIG95_00875 [Candidatus Woesearchaeota archaeon]